MIRNLLWILLLLLIASSCTIAANVGCMVYNNGLNFTDKELQRLEKSDEIQYIGVQMLAPAPHLRDVASRLARSGKKLIVQIWWGPDSPHSWSRFSMANIAQDSKIRADFFREIVDPIIDSIGPENIYTVHLLEETGMQFATDALEPGNPDDFSDDTGGGYNSPFYTGWSGNGAYGGPWILPLRRHNSDFTRFSGYNLFEAAIWNDKERKSFRQWVGKRVQALAHIRFAEHIHQKYPGILATSWDGPNFGGNVWADTPSMLNSIDGFTANCYNAPLQNYIFARTIRALDFDKTFQFMTWVGPNNLDINTRRAMLTSIYAVGSDIIHLWEEPQRCYARDDLWEISRKLYSTFSHLPVFTHRPDVFVICSNWNVPSKYLKDFDAAHWEDAEGYGLGRYKLVLLDGVEHPGLKEYVQNGGLAVMFHKHPTFLSNDQINSGKRVELSGSTAITVEYSKGTVLIIDNDKKLDDTDTHQEFVYKQIEQLATSYGLQKLFDKHFAPLQSGGRYMEITADDGSITCYFHHSVGQNGPLLKTQGTDLFTGDENPILGPNRSSVIVAHKSLVPWSPPSLPDRSKLVKAAEPGARRGQPDLPELPPDDPLGPARSNLTAPTAPVYIEGRKYKDWAVPECRYRLQIQLKPAQAGIADQPIVISGKELYRLTGMDNLAWKSIRVFAGSKEQPVQIDERDNTGHYLKNGNGRLDSDDELVFKINQSGNKPSIYYLYYGSKPAKQPAFDSSVKYEVVNTDIADAIISNGRMSISLKGPAREPKGGIGSFGTGAITECSLDGKPFTNIRNNWSNYFFGNPWSNDANWSKPELVIAGPIRSIIKTSLAAFTSKNATGQTILEGNATNYYAMYSSVPILDIEQRIEYPTSDKKWSAQYTFYTKSGKEPDANDVLLVPLAGKPTKAAMQDVDMYGTRYLEHRPEQGWMALLDPVEKHGCALFYARMPETRENLSWVDYAPRHELTPTVGRLTDGYPMSLSYTNRVMQTDDVIIRPFRIIGLTSEDGQSVAAQYQVWGNELAQLGRIEVQVR